MGIGYLHVVYPVREILEENLKMVKSVYRGKTFSRDDGGERVPKVLN